MYLVFPGTIFPSGNMRQFPPWSSFKLLKNSHALTIFLSDAFARKYPWDKSHPQSEIPMKWKPGKAFILGSFLLVS